MKKIVSKGTLADLLRFRDAAIRMAFEWRGPVEPPKRRTKTWWQARLYEWASIGRGLMLRSGILAYYTKLPDELLGAPDLQKAGRDATLLYIFGQIYISRRLTDGTIPETAFHEIAAGARRVRALADALVAVGRWVRTPDGYFDPHYLAHNDSKQQVEAKRAASRERQRRFRNGVTSRPTPRTYDRKPTLAPTQSGLDSDGRPKRSPTPHNGVSNGVSNVPPIQPSNPKGLDRAAGSFLSAPLPQTRRADNGELLPPPSFSDLTAHFQTMPLDVLDRYVADLPESQVTTLAGQAAIKTLNKRVRGER